MLQSADFLKSWKRNETAALITLFESERVLYDYEHPEHFNFPERDAAYSRILDIMQRVDADLNLLQIKRKLRFLLSKYATEERRKILAVRSGKFSERTYKPSFWYFSLMNFLNNFSAPYVCKYDFRDLDVKAIKEAKGHENRDKEVLSTDEDNYMVPKMTVAGFPNCSSSAFEDSNIHQTHEMHSKQKQQENGFETAKDCSKQELGFIKVKSVRSLRDGSETEIRKSKKRRNESIADAAPAAKLLRCEQMTQTDANLQEVTEIKKVNHDKMAQTEVVHEPGPTKKSLDREDIFGHYVSSEIKTLRDDSLLYLQTKQAILDIITTANFELLNPDS